MIVVAALLIPGVQLNPSEAQAKDSPGAGDAITGRNVLTTAGISAGVLKPFEILVEGRPSNATLGNDRQARRRDPRRCRGRGSGGLAQGR